MSRKTHKTNQSFKQPTGVAESGLENVEEGSSFFRALMEHNPGLRDSCRELPELRDSITFPGDPGFQGGLPFDDLLCRYRGDPYLSKKNAVAKCNTCGAVPAYYGDVMSFIWNSTTKGGTYVVKEQKDVGWFNYQRHLLDYCTCAKHSCERQLVRKLNRERKLEKQREPDERNECTATTSATMPTVSPKRTASPATSPKKADVPAKKKFTNGPKKSTKKAIKEKVLTTAAARGGLAPSDGLSRWIEGRLGAAERNTPEERAASKKKALKEEDVNSVCSKPKRTADLTFSDLTLPDFEGLGTFILAILVMMWCVFYRFE